MGRKGTKYKEGQIINGFKIISVLGTDGSGSTVVMAECHFCGNSFQNRASRLLVNKSCGCQFKGRKKHFNSVDGNLSPTYFSWLSMKSRCRGYTPKQVKQYVSKGIVICERWMDFSNFLEDMGERPSKIHSLDRYPNKRGNYEPGNCRWATPTQQQNNTQSNVLLTFKGETKTIAEWASAMGFARNTLYGRYRRGWSVEDILTVPFRDKERMLLKFTKEALAKKKPKIGKLTVVFNGETQPLNLLCKKMGKSWKRMWYRIFKMGLSPEAAFSIEGKLPIFNRALTTEQYPINKTNSFISYSFGHINA